MDPKALQDDPPPKDKEDEEEAKKQAEGGAPPWAAALMGMLEKISKKIGVEAEGDPEGPPEPAPPPQMAAGPVEVGLTGASLQAKAGELTTLKAEGAMAAMDARLKAMQARLDSQESETRIVKAAAKLQKAGFPESMVAKFSAVSRDRGEEAGKALAEGMQMHSPSDPPPSWSGEIVGQAPDPKEVATYAQKGPEMLERARDLHRSWLSTQSQVPLAEYLEIEIDPAGYIAGARS